MAILSKEARQGFWKRPGTFGIIGGFEAPGKLSVTLLEQCKKQGISAVPINPAIDEALGVKAVADAAQISSLAGIVCVRLDPYATAAVEKGAELRVPVWLSQGTASADAKAAAERLGADIAAGICPLMYLDVTSYHAFHRTVAKVFGQY
ncbi:MAG: CoA-binding protein [Coriobacteriia bacterium]|nr:CoA-binding protein [Coriobacteriia bacterium]